ncbi:hypothetical protein RMATCC62417_11351 [Rhizopus microsporus]|nr:hypothetical protein RMATCC62417_11351 [Rhizopus microsporus]
MENIPLNKNEQAYTRTEVEQLFKEFAKKFKLEEAERADGFPLHQDIQQELDESSPSIIQANIQRFARKVPKIEGGEWTTSETINKEFVQELKKRKIDVYQHVSSKYKDAERLRTSAKAATSICIEDTTAVRSVLPSTVSNWVKNHMKCVGVDLKKYKAHSLRSASSTFAIKYF